MRGQHGLVFCVVFLDGMRQMRGRHTRARATPKFEVHLLATHKLVSQLAFQLMSDPVIATPITQHSAV